MRNLKIFSIISIAISVCIKRAAIRNASILLALKNKGLTHKLEACVTVCGQTLIILLLSVIVVHAQISPPKNSEQFLGSGQEFTYSMNSGGNENLQGKILEVTPEYWFFGARQTQEESTKAFVFSNIGTESFDVIIPAITGEFFAGDGGQTLTVEPNQSQNIVFGFHPVSWGFKFKTVIISNQSDNAPNKKVYLSGIGGEMTLDVTPRSWDYGIVVVGNNSDTTFTLKNVTQNDTINLAKISIESGASNFSIINPDIPINPFDLKPKDSVKVTVRFHPTAPDTQIDFFKVNFLRDGETPDSFMVFLKGIGGITGKILKVLPESFNFDSVSVGKDSVTEFLLINEGTQDIKVDSVTIGQGEFSVVKIPGKSFYLTQGHTDTVSVSFSPVSMGLKLDMLKIWNDSDNATQVKEIPLRGTGVHKILTVTPDSSYDFGRVSIKDSSDQIFILKNEGNQSFDVTKLSIETGNEFKLVNPPATKFTLSKGETQNVKIRFSPLTVGDKEAFFKIENNSDNASPVKEIQLKGTGTTRILVTEPDNTVDFGTISITDSADKLIVLKNTGDEDLNVTALSIEINQGEQGTFYLAQKYEPFTLTPTKPETIKVRFKPLGAGYKQGVLKISNNSDNASPVKEIKLKGTGKQLTKILTVEPESLDFGVVAVGNDSDMVIMLKNDGNDDLSVTRLFIPITPGQEREFSLVDTSDTLFTLASKETKEINIRFKPLTSGFKEAILKIANNSDNASPVKEIILKGTGLVISKILVAEPDSVNFGTVAVGNDSDSVIELRNEGNSELSVTGLSIEIISGEQVEFSLTASPNLPFALRFGSPQNITVRFHPSIKGSKKGILKIQNNSDNASPIKEVYLTGNSLDAVILSFINYPNPFGNETTIEYNLSKPSKVSINIYDVSGDLLVELKNHDQKEWDSHREDKIVWDGTDFNGRRLANGVYICELIAVADNGKEEHRYRKIAIFEK